MKDLENRLSALCMSIAEDLGKDTKAAHARIRKATLEFAKIAKEYRKVSVEADKA